MMQSNLRFLLLLVVWLLAACGGEPAPPPTLLATALPVQTFTPVPTATATPLPSRTPIPPTAVPSTTPVLQYPTETPPPSATPPPTATSVAIALETVIGSSVEERPLLSYQFKNGLNQIVLVGGIHGGYEWNSIALAYELVDYFTANLDAVPDTVTLHIIPSANPDGQFMVTGENGRFSPEAVAEMAEEGGVNGRFNANEVDLNRNWDCNWYASAYWRDQWVSGGDEPFSEPETQALRDFLLEKSPQLVLFFHSAAGGVFASGCGEVHAPSLKAAQMYGLASGYPVYERFDAYTVTGDAGDWLAGEGIANFTVELTDHETLDWEDNLAGIKAILAAYR